MIWYDQFAEMIEDAVKSHISRDQSVCVDDQLLEMKNLTATLAKELRLCGVQISPPSEVKPRDLSQFEGV